MTDTTTHVDDEFEQYKTNVTGWISSVSALPVSDSRRGTHERFVRDCETFNADIQKAASPSSADLVDFGDLHNSLESRFHQLTDSAQ